MGTLHVGSLGGNPGGDCYRSNLNHCFVGYEEILFEALDRYDEALLGQRRFSRESFFGAKNMWFLLYEHAT